MAAAVPTRCNYQFWMLFLLTRDLKGTASSPAVSHDTYLYVSIPSLVSAMIHEMIYEKGGAWKAGIRALLSPRGHIAHTNVVHRESETAPRNTTQPLTPYYLHLWIEMSLRILSVASPLVSLFFFSAFVVAQIVAPTCNSSAEWEWVFILWSHHTLCFYLN
jgi:hypothetical protein